MQEIVEIGLNEKLVIYDDNMVSKISEDISGNKIACPSKKFFIRDLEITGDISWRPYHHFPCAFPAFFDFTEIDSKRASNLWIAQSKIPSDLFWVCPVVNLEAPEEIWSLFRRAPDNTPPLSVLLTSDDMGRDTTVYGVYHDQSHHYEGDKTTRLIHVSAWRKIEDNQGKDRLSIFPEPLHLSNARHCIISKGILDVLKVYNNPPRLEFALNS